MKTLLLVFLLAYSSFSFAGFKLRTQATFTATTTSTKILNGSSYRTYLMMINNGANSVAVKVGSAHTGFEGVVIPSGGYYEPFVAPSDSIYLISTSGTSAVFVLEGGTQ